MSITRTLVVGLFDNAACLYTKNRTWFLEEHKYMLMDRNKILSVRELNNAAKQLIESGLPLLWVRGEISNFVNAASGHWYFSLKDDQAQVRCVMFRHKSQYLDWLPRNGMQIEVLALPSLYEARGDFQLTLEQMRLAGTGALYEAFEKLKKKLEGEGLFADTRKRDLPHFPVQVGIITSPQAAALRDVMATLEKRMPSLPAVLYPTPVQGAGSALKIAEAIALANQRKECEVIILCRGGGSIEDLWSFNEEVVARAIASSQIPVVSGVGHETDFTIADFVADFRAATPTAAAQAVIPDRQELLQRTTQFEQRMSHTMLRRLELIMQQLDFMQRRLVHPANRLQQQIQYLGQLQQRMRVAQPDWEQYSRRYAEAGRRMKEAMHRMHERCDVQLSSVKQHLQHLDPDQVLARGYSVVRDGHGSIVVDSSLLSLGERLDITYARGTSQVEVKVLKN